MIRDGKELLAAAVLFVAVFWANIQMALIWRDKPLPYRAAAWGHPPLQVPLIAWALRISATTLTGCDRW